MAGPDEIIAMSDMLDQIQQSESEKTSNSEAIDNIGKNVIDSSIYGVENKPPKVKPALTGPEKTRLKNKMDIVVESWFKLKKKYTKDTKASTVVAGAQESGEAGMPTEEGGKKAGSGLMSWLSGLMGMLGMGKGGLTRLLGKWVWKGIKWGGTKIWGALKSVGSAAWTAVKAGFKGVGDFFSGLWKGFTSSGFWKSFTGAISNGLNAAKGALQSAGSFLKNSLASVGKFAQNTLSAVTGGKVPRATPKPPKPPKPSKPSAAKRLFGWIGKKAKQAKTAVSAGVSYVADKAVKVKDVVVKKAVQAKTAVVKVAKAAGNLVGAPFRAAVKAAKDYFMKGGGKKGLRGVLKKIPFIGAAIEGVFAGFDIKKYSKDPEGTIEDLKTQIGARIIKGLGSTIVGSALAAALAGVPGGIILSPLGFMGGAWLGGKVAEWLTDAFPNAATGVGNFMLNMFPGLVANKEAAMAAGDEKAVQKKELQDFIMQRGKVMPFSSKDEILGMKKGGAISQLLGESKSKHHHSNKERWVSSLLGRSRDNIDKLLGRSRDTIGRLLGRSKDSIGKLIGTWKKTSASSTDRKSTDRKMPTSEEHAPRITHVEPAEGSDRLAKLQISAIDLSNKYLYQIVQLTQALVKKSGSGSGGTVVNVPAPANTEPGTQGDPSGPSMPDSRVEFYNSPYSMHTPGTLA